MRNLLEAILARLQQVFDPQLVGSKIVDIAISLIAAVVIFAGFYLAWLLIQIFLKAVISKTNLDKTSQDFIKTITKYAILLTGLFQALSSMNVDTAGLLASLGIAGITIGFAARDAFSNLISGLLIYLDRPFVIGDLIEIGDFYGKVEQITLRSTRIITSDGKMLAVPNAEIINKTVTSYTNFPNIRLDIEVTIGVNEDIGKVRQILLDILGGDPDYLEDPPARVILTQLNDYNVAVELQAWIQDERSHVEKRAELRERVFNALNQAHVEMPFETIQLSPLKVSVDQD